MNKYQNSKEQFEFKTKKENSQEEETVRMEVVKR